MFNIMCAHRKRLYLFPLLALILLSGCSSMGTSQTSPTPTPTTQQASSTPTPTTAPAQDTPTPTPATPQDTPTPTPAPAAFSSYVGTWQVHGEQLTINADHTGLELWNAGPCSSGLCSGNAHITFTENADGSITGTITSLSYLQGNGTPSPDFTPSADDPRTGDSFQLQHSGAHLLYTTWSRGSLNSNNRYWCDATAVHSGMSQCGA